MIRIYAYVNLNLKILLKDKITFIWSILLPLFTLLINYKSINTIDSLVYWWVYIIINTFIFGIGIHALNTKEAGSLKTMFSIKRSPVEFFLANLITQIIYIIAILIIFNLFASFLIDQNYFLLFLYSIKAIFFLLPFAFLSQNISLIKGVYAPNISTIFNILIFVMFILSGIDFPYNYLNPLILISTLLIESSYSFSIGYLIFYIFSILISIFSIINYTPISSERR